MIGIYKITNTKNQKCYIGQSTNIEKRWKNHLSVINNTKDHCYDYPIYRAMRKYGVDSFLFEILEECSVDVLDQREQYWINHFNSYKNGYNQTIGGNNPQSKVKDYIKDITYDLKNTSLSIEDISIKYNLSYEMIQGINTGRYWARNIDYPIRERNKSVVYYCKNCGAEISRNSVLCIDCYRHSHEKPTRAELKELVYHYSFKYIGKLFGVSDKCISKWCQKYDLPFKKKDISNYSYTEWCLL